MKEQLALELFGTSDVEGVLSVLPPSDASVREYYRRLKTMNEDKGASTCQTQKTE